MALSLFFAVLMTPAPEIFTCTPRPSWLGQKIATFSVAAFSAVFFALCHAAKIVGVRDGDIAYAVSDCTYLIAVTTFRRLSKIFHQAFGKIKSAFFAIGGNHRGD